MKVSVLGNCATSNYTGIGGVSIHVFRLGGILFGKQQLNRVYNTIYVQRKELNRNHYSYSKKDIQDFYNTKNVPWVTLLPSFKNAHLNLIAWFFRYILFDRAKILHVHNELSFCYLYFLLHKFFKKHLVFTIHDQMILVKVLNSKKGKYYFLKLLIKNKTIKWIAVNETISKQLILLGAEADNVVVIPAYLPANEHGFELSTELKRYFESHTPNMFFYAFGIKQLNGVDLYGLDMALESVKYLKLDYPKIGLFLLIPDADKDPNMLRYLEFVSEHNLQENIKFHFEVIPDLNVICEKSEIYLRPTYSDGDSLTVREALHKNIKVLVSDVVERPKGCILFKNRDVEDMIRKIKETFQSFDIIEEDKPQESTDFFDKISKVYNSTYFFF
jgi:hypothetical protein